MEAKVWSRAAQAIAHETAKRFDLNNATRTGLDADLVTVREAVPLPPSFAGPDPNHIDALIPVISGGSAARQYRLQFLGAGTGPGLESWRRLAFTPRICLERCDKQFILHGRHKRPDFACLITKAVKSFGDRMTIPIREGQGEERRGPRREEGRLLRDQGEKRRGQGREEDRLLQCQEEDRRGQRREADQEGDLASRTPHLPPLRRR